MGIKLTYYKEGERGEVDNEWPRIIQPVLCRSRHVICRLCCSSGDLKEVIVTPSKHGKKAYRCAKASRWGDLFSFKIKPHEKMTSKEKQNY
nr:methyltransferase-like protein 17, mitochondrial [Halyomorpha halys]